MGICHGRLCAILSRDRYRRYQPPPELPEQHVKTFSRGRGAAFQERVDAFYAEKGRHAVPSTEDIVNIFTIPVGLHPA